MAPPEALSINAARHPLLFEALPPLKKNLAWERLTDGVPTPLAPLAGLGERAQIADLWIKRDDQTSAAYGGNKPRKLEWLLADARRRGARAVTTLGAWGSHHALATAVFAARAGLRAYLCLYPQPVTEHVVRNLRADLGAGARLSLAPALGLLPLAHVAAVVRSLVGGTGWPYRIPGGGSNALGSLGYVECGLEIARQVEAGEMPAPRHVYVAAGTCGTLAGLRWGLSLGASRVPALADTVVHGVRVVPAIVTNAALIARLTRGVGRILAAGGLAPGATPCAVDLLTGHLGAGYGKPTPDGERALAVSRETEGLELEPTYTAKAMAGLLAFARDVPGPHLYVHTLSGADLAPLIAKGAASPRRLPRSLRSS